MEPKIFFSRERKDDLTQKVIGMVLGKLPAGWIWVDVQNPKPGEYLSQKILRAIKQSTHMILIWDNTTHQNCWVNQEIGAACQKGIRVLPLLQKGIAFKGLLEGREGTYYDPDYPFDGISDLFCNLKVALREDDYQFELLDMEGIRETLDTASKMVDFLRLGK